MATYDVAVAYRVYPRVSRPALDLPFGDDKLRLVYACLRSFSDCLRGLRVKVWALLDTCPENYQPVFRACFPSADLEFVPFKRAGNAATFTAQMDILLAQQDSDIVYFAEDDYFYLPNQFAEMVEFLCQYPDVDFVSPFDHSDYYRLHLHAGPQLLRAGRKRLWRSAASTCLTFLTHKQTLKAHEQVFRSYSDGNYDSSLWLSLTKHQVRNPIAAVRYLLQNDFAWKIMAKSWWYTGRQIMFGSRCSLWVPVPTIATHLDSNGLAPGTDWIAVLDKANRGLDQVVGGEPVSLSRS